MNALRQPQSSPIHAPIGAAQTVATDTPVRISDIARANWCSGTSRIASAAAIDQKPPSATPSITRAISSVQRLSAVAASPLDSTSSRVSATITCLRSRRLVSRGMDGAATAPSKRRGGHRLAGNALADRQVGSHRSEQAGGQELGSDQAEYAERQ